MCRPRAREWVTGVGHAHSEGNAAQRARKAEAKGASATKKNTRRKRTTKKSEVKRTTKKSEVRKTIAKGRKAKGVK